MDKSSLNEQTIISQLSSNDPFPVDFDDAWVWLGFTRKDSAKRSLLSAGFAEGVDFHIFVEATTTGISGNPEEKIKLSVDCFKTWGMMSRTDGGRKVREFYLKVEKNYKKLLEQIQQQKLESERIEVRLPGIDTNKAYVKCCRTFMKKTGKGCMFHIGKTTNMVYKAYLGISSRQLEQKYPLTYWALKRDIFQKLPLELISRIEARFVHEMEEANYNFKSLMDCMKFTLKQYPKYKVDIENDLLIPEWEETLLEKVKEKNPGFNYEDLKQWVADGNDVRKYPRMSQRVIESVYKGEGAIEGGSDPDLLAS